jgi:aspartyl-tRNA(Asn)/glutamyl-tRNA(Gln) amidotransferase subunit A
LQEQVFKSLSEIKAALESGSMSLKDIVQNYLKNIQKSSHLNIFLEVFEEEALKRADEVQSKLKAGNAGPLAGMVVAVKDNICYKDHKVSAASKILDGFESLYSATAIERLLDADTILIGRVNCDEFAMGGSNENSGFGLVRNPLDEERVPGGSSGGSAAAVAANCCLAALGSDTGGSIRQPASFCGVVGFKPTYGRVSRHGLIAFASSFDQIGPITHSVEDAARIMEVIAGKDEMDTTSSSQPVDSYVFKGDSTKKIKIGYIQETLDSEALDPSMRRGMMSLIESLKSEGHEVEEVHIPELDTLVPAYYVLTTAEASSNLSRYDGIHYGHRSSKATDVESTYTKSRSEGFGAEVKRRIMLGTFVLSAGYYDAYYAKAQKVRRILQDETLALFEKYDVLLSPTTPSHAFKIGENTDDPIRMYLEDIFTVHANLAGIPAMSLPLIKHEENGLPMGVQIMAAPFREGHLFEFAHNLMNKNPFRN